MKQILLIEDNAFFRMMVRRKLSNRSGIVIAETPNELDGIHVEDFGLVIVDRVLPGKWGEAWQVLSQRFMSLPDQPEFIEWTAAPPDNQADEQYKPLVPFALVIYKTGPGSELVSPVNRWIRTGSVCGPAIENALQETV